MKKKSGNARRSYTEVTVSPWRWSQLEERPPLWSETEEEIAAGIEWGCEKAALLRWVRKQLNRRLTQRERRTVELLYFEGMSPDATADRIKVHRTTVYAARRRAIRKLKAAAAEDGIRCVRRRRPRRE